MENVDENVKKKPMENQEDLVEALKRTKENSVSKEEYQKLKEENKKLIDAFANGEPMPGASQEQTPELTLEQARKNLINAKTNLEYAKASLALRDLNLKQNGIDDYLPNGANFSPTSLDKESAERVAKLFKDCIESCNGNSAVFTAQFDSLVDDIKLPFKK